MKTILVIGLLAAVVVLAGFTGAILFPSPQLSAEVPPKQPPAADRTADQELAYLLVKLQLKTRSVIAEHFTRPQSSVPGIDVAYQRWLTKNLILPAAVAGRIFAEVVPESTGGRAWVKMVVPEPRNPQNRGDGVALAMLKELRTGAKSAEQSTPDACYYGEPIVARAWCMRCHGEARGEPDPSFPQYKKDGWKEGEVIGAVIARVAPKK